MILIASASLLLIGAAPVSAAPGGVPGPPANHGSSADHGHSADTDVAAPDGDASNVPDWAKAYGKRIQDEYGMTYGHLQQCAGVSVAEDGDEVSSDDEDSSKTLDCPDNLEFPEETGAKAFWVFTEEGMLILGI